MLLPRWTVKSRAGVLSLLGIAAVAFVLRALPLLQVNGALGRADFDAGVYFSAAGLFVKGMAPYRDFVFLHPPGIILALSPIAAAVGRVEGTSSTLWKKRAPAYPQR